MAYREIDEVSAQRAAALKELNELATHGDLRVERAPGDWTTMLPFVIAGWA